jgi:hypothetical protein
VVVTRQIKQIANGGPYCRTHCLHKPSALYPCDHRGLCSRGHAFVLSHRAQDYDYSHEDPRPSDSTEVTAIAHPIEGDGLGHYHR